MDDIDTQNIELQLLLQAIYLKYGYDFRNYAKASIKRRVHHRLVKEGLDSVSAMQHKLLYDVSFFERLLLDLSIGCLPMSIKILCIKQMCYRPISHQSIHHVSGPRSFWIIISFGILKIA